MVGIWVAIVSGIAALLGVVFTGLFSRSPTKRLQEQVDLWKSMPDDLQGRDNIAAAIESGCERVRQQAEEARTVRHEALYATAFGILSVAGLVLIFPLSAQYEDGILPLRYAIPLLVFEVGAIVSFGRSLYRVIVGR